MDINQVLEELPLHPDRHTVATSYGGPPPEEATRLGEMHFTINGDKAVAVVADEKLTWVRLVSNGDLVDGHRSCGLIVTESLDDKAHLDYKTHVVVSSKKDEDIRIKLPTITHGDTPPDSGEVREGRKIHFLNYNRTATVHLGSDECNIWDPVSSNSVDYFRIPPKMRGHIVSVKLEDGTFRWVAYTETDDNHVNSVLGMMPDPLVPHRIIAANHTGTAMKSSKINIHDLETLFKWYKGTQDGDSYIHPKTMGSSTKIYSAEVPAAEVADRTVVFTKPNHREITAVYLPNIAGFNDTVAVGMCREGCPITVVNAGYGITEVRAEEGNPELCISDTYKELYKMGPKYTAVFLPCIDRGHKYYYLMSLTTSI